ncbi:MAG: protein translocase subunit SecA 2 [Pirellulaceae bacterium]|nr:MAG: protein translocase subunit SecA 2 [Pirellulaceae bacterium]
MNLWANWWMRASQVSNPLRLARWWRLVEQVNALEPELQKLSNYELRKRSLSLRYRAKAGEPPSRFLVEAYALVREASCRTTGLRHYDVQILGGIALFFGYIAEMDTGEGKTLTATLPLYLHALAGKGAHLATVNDYLAQRDAELLRPLYELLGLSVGLVLTGSSPEERRTAYAADITYGTAKEFGFDFLRDRLLLRRMGVTTSDFLGEGSSQRWDVSGEQPVQRGFYFGLVDEADSVLIDEARTPLIIGAIDSQLQERIAAAFAWSASVAPQFVEDEHYHFDHDEKKVELTAAGRQLVRTLPRYGPVRSMGLVDLYEYVERAIKVHREYHRDRQYIVENGEVVIIDEYTGRKAEGRKWRDGIHQAVEAKEGLRVTVPTGQAARITVQDLFLRYRYLAGMTGTALPAAREFRKIYRTPVVRIPTNRPIIRIRWPDKVFGTSQAKWEAIVQEVQELHSQGRPVLIGTRSIDKSQHLSLLLSAAGIPHQVLNAHEIAREAQIVAQAGQRGRVTVATNMAGRGTDIKLGPGVAQLGGLHVIISEMHDAARIDRQLAGRCGRQGDPGTYRQYLALDDEILLNGFGPQVAERWKERGARKPLGPWPGISRLFRRAQRRVERRHFRDRAALLYHEKQRKKMQRELGQDPYLDTPD